jgi:hypothetical protein
MECGYPVDPAAMTDLARDWRELQARLTREYVETKNAIDVGERLNQAYARLDSAERHVVNAEVGRWLLSDDEGLRFDARALIASQHIASAKPELRQLAERLKTSKAPGAPFERRRVLEVLEALDADDG